MHIKRVHDKIPDKECPHCEFQASNNMDVKNHIQASHLGITYNSVYNCDKCEATFTQLSSLYPHKSVNSEERPFVCLHCAKGFKKKKGLERHVEAFHCPSTFPCKDCGKVLKLDSYLTDHMR